MEMTYHQSMKLLFVYSVMMIITICIVILASHFLASFGDFVAYETNMNLDRAEANFYHFRDFLLFLGGKRLLDIAARHPYEDFRLQLPYGHIRWGHYLSFVIIAYVSWQAFHLFLGPFRFFAIPALFLILAKVLQHSMNNHLVHHDYTLHSPHEIVMKGA